MSEDSTQKIYPVATPQVAAMLGLPANAEAAHETLPVVSSGDLPVANLPVAEDYGQNISVGALPVQNAPKTNPVAPAKAVAEAPVPQADPVAPLPEDVIAQDIAAAEKSKLGTVLRILAPYVAVFLIGIGLYVFYFKNVDFSAWFHFGNSAQTVSTPKQTVLAQLQQQNLPGYYAWVNTYYYDVSDPSIISPDSDNSGNGLTNFEKYLLNLNPKSYDTLGLGRSDTESLSIGINPLTGSPLTDAQKAIVDKYIDLEVAMNRLTLDHLQNPGLPNATSTVIPGNSRAGVDSAGANLSPGANFDGNFGTNGTSQGTVAGATSIRGEGGVPGAQATSPTPSQVDTQVNLGDNQASYAIENNGDNISINTSVPGRLQVPGLKMDVPIIWSANIANFDTDLESGVIHYPGTAMPGQLGTTYIAGHSSNYVWAKGSYNHVFTHLDQMAVDASFSITVTQTNGKQAIFHYVVTSQQQFSPTDQAQFKNQAKSMVALSTCWPVNSTAKRLVVFGQLTQVEQ